MSLSSQIKISNEGDIAAFRRKIYQVSLQITQNEQIASTITSNVSEILKLVIQKIAIFNVETFFDHNDHERSIKISLLFPQANKESSNFLASYGFWQDYLFDSQEVIKLTKSYRISQISEHLPNDRDLKEILEMKSRDALFAEINGQQKALQQILDNSPVSIGFRVGEIYRYTNRMYESHFGIRSGDTINDIYAIPEQRDMLQKKLAKDGFLDDEDAVFKMKDGQLRPSKFTILPMEYRGENGYMVWINDVTEQEEAKAAILHAKSVAEEATKAKSDFLANMSHEIRTPMNAIIGMSHLALQGNLERKERNYIEKVNRAGENLLGIINDILDFSKIEAGKMSMEEIDFDLDDVMDNLANLISMKAEDKGVELLFSISEEVPMDLIGDPLRLGQILINLSNNAVKFTDTGEIIVSVEKVSEDSNGIRLHFKVQDSGIGMTPEQCSKMFQSFSQADASTTRKYGGTGLGLAISKNLVELMDGRIWVESEAGKGSVFQFEIKLKKQVNPSAKRVVRVEKLVGKRVLVVDDNASAREVLVLMVKSLGMNVDIARNGLEAIEAVQTSKLDSTYDVILMDWQMPKMDGLEAAKKITAFDNAPQIIMITSFGREEVLDEVHRLKINLENVITKPVAKLNLIEAIGNALHHNRDGERREINATKATDNFDKLRNLKVLLVEDNPLNQELAMELLRQAGMAVTLANNGQEALDALKVDPTFECVLMDCQMPVMDGYTATREIRKIQEFEKLPIIAMTANAMAGDKEKVIEAGMWDHISKPLHVKTMFATIAKWVSHNSSAEPVELQANSASTPDAKPTVNLPSISDLAGIDIKVGLANTMDNQILYRRLLGMFYESQKDFSNAFTAAQQDSDPDAAMRCAHTLKGNAGNIGAKGVQKAAGELEGACKNKASNSEINKLMLKVVSELEPVILGLSALNADQVDDSAASSFDLNKIKGELDVLRSLLEDSDGEASDCLGEILHDVRGNAIATQLKGVLKSVDDFDFDAALEKLNKIVI